MKLTGFKKLKPLKANFWFAWYPVFAFDMTIQGDNLGIVWLEKVWCRPWRMGSMGYQHFRLSKDGKPLTEDYKIKGPDYDSSKAP